MTLIKLHLSMIKSPEGTLFTIKIFSGGSWVGQGQGHGKQLPSSLPPPPCGAAHDSYFI